MKLLVIGREGQLARALAEARRPADLDLACVGRPDVDLTKSDSLARAIDRVRPELIVNAAAYTLVDKAEDEEALAFAVNADGVGALGQAAAERGVPVIHVSTDYVYDGSKLSGYVESDPTAPLGAYGRSKLAGEQQLAAAQPQHVILRTAWVYAPYGTNFARTMLRLGGERSVLRVVADQIGNPTYAPHLADAILEVAAGVRASPTSPVWGVYHASGTGETSWHGFAERIFADAAKYGMAEPRVDPITTADYPTPAARPANSRLDCGKLNSVFGVTLPDWTKGVSEFASRTIGHARAEPAHGAIH